MEADEDGDRGEGQQRMMLRGLHNHVQYIFTEC
jgi:hypothetical protein